MDGSAFLAVLEKVGVSAWVRHLATDSFRVTPGVWLQLGYESQTPSRVTEWRALVHPDDLLPYERSINELRLGRSDQLYTIFRLRAADSTWRTLEARGGILASDDNKPIMVGGTITDITARAPLTSPALFKTIIEAANEGIWMIDLHGRTWFANQRMADMLGTTADEMVGLSPAEFCLPEELEVARDVISRNLAGEGVEFEIRFRKQDGTEIPVLGASAPIPDENGIITGSVAMFSDLTGRKATERALFESERAARISHARLAAAQEGAGAGAWEVDLGTETVLLDDVCLELHGLPAGIPMPLTIQQWIGTFDANGDTALEALRECVAHGNRLKFEFSTQGGKKWVLGLGSAIRSDGRNIGRVVGLSLNTTESKHAERQLAQMRAELVHVARVTGMGSMASTIAHELNQPLAAIANYLAAAEMMMEQGDYHAVASAIKSAGQATLKAGEMIRRIRASVTRGDPTRRVFDLRELVDSALQLALVDARQRGIRVSKRFDRGMVVLADPVQIEQVIINLVRNAVDAVSEVHNPRINLSCRVSANRVIFQVTDNGTGVSREMVNSVFDSFVTSKSEGMGIGLSICRTIIEDHDGKIWLERTSPEGSVFKFDLPRFDDQSAAPVNDTSAGTVS